ncbi:hypothetical protein [Amycolatopsis sp. NPDC051903]|uniref:hypothetical protein n=1 Tax=Amycolatopsis sp. NPDC051903 TaxID=3363936 RepID=UPI003795ADA4
MTVNEGHDQAEVEPLDVRVILAGLQGQLDDLVAAVNAQQADLDRQRREIRELRRYVEREA